MFENIIKFSAAKEYVKNNKDLLPTPIKTNIPDWFKKLDSKIGKTTIKGCMPFLDTLTTGYLLKTAVDYHIIHNVTINGEKKTGFSSGKEDRNSMSETINLNYDGRENFHPTAQLAGSPLIEKNKNLPIHKILNPWTIKTPPGYSTLFLPPLNNADDRFSIIPGIVDTDTFTNEVNFPIIVNSDKYPELDSTIQLGTPYVQVIPFKREKWKMKIIEEDKDKIKENLFFQKKYIINNYKKIFWKKKSWK